MDVNSIIAFFSCLFIFCFLGYLSTTMQSTTKIIIRIGMIIFLLPIIVMFYIMVDSAL